MRGDGGNNGMLQTPLNGDRVEVARTLLDLGNRANSEMLQSDLINHGVHHGKTQPGSSRHFHQSSVLEFGNHPGPDILSVKPFLERLTHSHVVTRQ